MTEARYIHTIKYIARYLTSYLIAAGTTEVVLHLSAAHTASCVCALHKYVCKAAQVNKFIDSK